MDKTKNTYKSIVGEDTAAGQGKPTDYLKSYLMSQGSTGGGTSGAQVLKKMGYDVPYDTVQKDYDVDTWARNNPNLVTEVLGKAGLGTQEGRVALEGQQTTPGTGITAEMRARNPQITPQTIAYDTATGRPLAPGATTMQDGKVVTQGTKYQQAHQALKGSPAPQDAGQGKMQAGAKLQSPQKPASPLGAIMNTDTNFDSIFTNLDKYMEPLAQKKSLVQEYEALSKSLGIQGLNAELIDAKKIIEGTEDDIRAEVTAAGGFATDSQVLALSNARNKSLIKNYNVLLESRDNAMQQLNTMMDLTMEDRRAAEAEFDRKMDFTFKVAEFQQRATDNSRTQLNKVVENVGYAGLLEATNGNTYEQSLIEKTLGLAPGGLAQLATYTPPLSEEDKLDLDLKRSSLKTDELQRKSISSSLETDAMQRKKLQAEIDKVESEITAAESPEQVQRKAGAIELAKELLNPDEIGKTSAVGASAAKLVPFGKQLGWQGNRVAFENKVNTLKANLTLDNLKLLKGAMSDKDLLFLQSVGSSLSTGMSEENFDKELRKIIHKLDPDDPEGISLSDKKISEMESLNPTNYNPHN